MESEELKVFRQLQADVQPKMPGDWVVKLKYQQQILPNKEFEACALQLQAFSNKWATVLEGSPAWMVKMALAYEFEGSKP